MRCRPHACFVTPTATKGCAAALVLSPRSSHASRAREVVVIGAKQPSDRGDRYRRDPPVRLACVAWLLSTRRRKSLLTAASVIPAQTFRTSIAEDLVAPVEPGWSSASGARAGGVGCAILSESFRLALADQLVDRFGIVRVVGERAAQLLGCGAALSGRGVGRVRRPGHGLIVAGGLPPTRGRGPGWWRPAWVLCLSLGGKPASSGFGGSLSVVLAPKRICGLGLVCRLSVDGFRRRIERLLV